jgi:hypothetical protein
MPWWATQGSFHGKEGLVTWRSPLLLRPSTQSMPMMMPLHADDGVFYAIVVCVLLLRDGKHGHAVRSSIGCR